MVSFILKARIISNLHRRAIPEIELKAWINELGETALNEKNIKLNSFIDIGSNLGLYVFTACLLYGIQRCIGIDYNLEYIEKTNMIKDRLKLNNCTFKVNKFEEINEEYDCVVAVGLIHHLYHRTESYGSLEPIIKSI